MSPKSNKTRGAKFETDVAAYLVANGFPHAERRHLAGAADRGDMAGVIDNDGDKWCVELKNCVSLDLPGWWRETQTEAVNAGVLHKIIVVRRRGTTDVGQAWVVTSLEDWAAEHAPQIA